MCDLLFVALGGNNCRHVLNPMTDLASLFLNPQDNAHLRYETLRAAFVDKMPLRDVADHFGFSYGTVRNLCSEFRKNTDMSFFLPD